MADSTKRVSRDSQTRAKSTRRKPWTPPSKLEAPEPPAGYSHRWIRTSLRGEDDTMNVSSRLREGWEPVRADEYPELKGRYPTIEDGQHAGVIGVGGLMLARIPEETVEEEKPSEEVETEASTPSPETEPQDGCAEESSQPDKLAE